MKIRKTINNNRDAFIGRVFEDNKRIIVEKIGDTLRNSPKENETFIFNNISEFEEWVKTQDWIRFIK